MDEIAKIPTDGAAKTSCALRLKTNEDLLYEVMVEYCQISKSLKNLNSAIEADPKSIRQEHKDLWKKQAEYMEGYKKILADRIKDILEHN